MRMYTKEFTGEKVLLDPTVVWMYADKERLLGIRDTTIYMHYRAWKRMSYEFQRQCKLRNIAIEVVH